MSGRTYLADDQALATVHLPDDERMRTLAEWWIGLTERDINATLPKVVEYSAHDLELTGDFFQFLAPQAPDEVLPAELTCWFYLVSKVTRAMGALKDGLAPSDDTVRDIRIYAAMITRIREAGGWPGLAGDK